MRPMVNRQRWMEDYRSLTGCELAEAARAWRALPETHPAKVEQTKLSRLELAAPDLLAALQYMVEVFNSADIDAVRAFATIEKARAVIEKATK